jgi:putative Ca2+/H+ antiporter (TMEM165/GDT1 family)
VSVAIGGIISRLLPVYWINIASGLLFIVFGLWTFFKKEGDEHGDVESRGGNVILSALSLVTLELGDKTQFASLLLSAKFNSPLLVFMGLCLDQR